MTLPQLNVGLLTIYCARIST